MDEPVGQHRGVSIREGCHRREVCLKATGKEKGPFPAQPGPQSGFQLLMDRTATAHQTRSTGADPLILDGPTGGLLQQGMSGQIEIIIARQIKQALMGWVGAGGSQAIRSGLGHPGAQAAAASGRDAGHRFTLDHACRCEAMASLGSWPWLIMIHPLRSLQSMG